MHHAPSIPNWASEVNKHNACQNPRKVPARRNLTRLGQIEKLVLQYASTVAETFSSSDVVVYYNLKEEHGPNASKRVHDAVQRLVRRGILEKVDRGLYRLAVDTPLPNGGLYGTEAKENLFSMLTSCSVQSPALYRTAPPTQSPARAPARQQRRSRYLVRLHMRPADGGLEGAYVRAFVVREVVDHMLRALEVKVVELYGRSHLRRLRAWLRRSVEVRASALGVHGRYGRRSRGLLPLRYLNLGFAYEVGVDAVMDLPFDRLYAKVYVRDLTRDRSLLEYATGLVTGLA